MRDSTGPRDEGRWARMDHGDREPPVDDELRQALQDAFADRFDEVEWERLHGRIIADATGRDPAQVDAWATVAGWSRRGIPAATALLAAGLAALFIMPLQRQPPAPEPGFWPVAEELLSRVPESTRRLMEAGLSPEELLTALLTGARTEDDAT